MPALQLYAEMCESQQTLRAWGKPPKPEMQSAHSAAKLLLEFLRRMRPRPCTPDLVAVSAPLAPSTGLGAPPPVAWAMGSPAASAAEDTVMTENSRLRDALQRSQKVRAETLVALQATQEENALLRREMPALRSTR